jgi:acyl carrier protein
MTREEIYARLTKVFCEVFERDDIRLSDETTANDIDGWDSLTHITVMYGVQDEFDIRFSAKEIVGFKNIGQMVDAIEEAV